MNISCYAWKDEDSTKIMLLQDSFEWVFYCYREMSNLVIIEIWTKEIYDQVMFILYNSLELVGFVVHNMFQTR